MCDCIGFSTGHLDHSVESERRSEEQGRHRKAYRGLQLHASLLHQGHGGAGQCAGPWAGPGAGAGTVNSETGPELGYTHAHGHPQDESAVHDNNTVGNPPGVRPGARVHSRRPELLQRGRVELAHRLGTMVAQLQPAPGAKDCLQAMRDAESAEHSRRGTGSAAFRHKAAKAQGRQGHTDGARCPAGSAPRGPTGLEQLCVPARGGGSSGGEPDLQRSHGTWRCRSPASTSPGDAAAPAATTGASAQTWAAW